MNVATFDELKTMTTDALRLTLTQVRNEIGFITSDVAHGGPRRESILAQWQIERHAIEGLLHARFFAPGLGR